MGNEVCQLLLGQYFVDDGLELLVGVACIVVSLLEGGDVVRECCLWIGGLQDYVESGLKGV